MSSVPPAIAEAYDPDRFRTDGHRLIDAVGDALGRWQHREGAALPWVAPEAARARWASERFGGADLVGELGRIMASSTAVGHPHCMAMQVPPPLPGAALGTLVSSVLANGMAIFDMGPASVPIELALIDWMCRRLGLPADAGGVMTSGGSLGNLTAMLAMRQAHAGFDVWRDGAHGGPPLAVVTSIEAHYSVNRTLGIMGWGTGGAIAAAVDDHHRLTAASVREALRTAGPGVRVIGIVAAAGSTATGAFDPLDELADLAERERLWLHVDAAHGGGVALSPTHRSKLAGIERADSVVWDAHKLLMMPAVCTAVLFKQHAHAYGAFATRASYLYQDAEPDARWWDLGTRTLECTKRMMAIELWCALRVHGEALFGDIVDRLAALGAAFGTKVAAAADFELAIAPELNIVCYRHRPTGMTGDALDAHNRALRQRLVEDGRFYIGGADLAGGYFLRSSIMNPLIEPADFDDLLEHLRALCRS